MARRQTNVVRAIQGRDPLDGCVCAGVPQTQGCKCGCRERSPFDCVWRYVLPLNQRYRRHRREVQSPFGLSERRAKAIGRCT
eukprot:scaffold48977_cov58-Phaeocystis_antarctica.AAC.3